MIDLGSILPSLLSNLTKLIPFRTVYSFQQAVRFSRGRPIRLITQPGWYFHIPKVWELVIGNCMQEVLSGNPITVTTKDGHQWLVDPMIRCHTFDLMRWTCNVQDADESMLHEVYSAVSTAAGKFTKDEIRTDPGPLSRAARNALNRVVRKWGVEVEYVGFGDYFEPVSIRLIQT